MPLIPDSQAITDGTTPITLIFRNHLAKDGEFYGAQRVGSSASVEIQLTTKVDTKSKTVQRNLISAKFTRVTSGVSRYNTINFTVISPKGAVDAEVEQDIAYVKSLLGLAGVPAAIADDLA